ncbi:unnamed protein product [Candidula unifasciata]|uniref:Uncharacterized protein n=1 Tax=Candidula unifasciata TaxID=100452 RepID=A0A8S3Z7M9_9EUPU|nr:unnamed protein product [Candidula unifasciata]
MKAYPGACTVIIAVVMVAAVSADYSSGLTLEKNECQFGLQNCTAKYDKLEMSEAELKVYYDCVSRVKCIRNHRGFQDRLVLLSSIRDRLVAENPDSGNWWGNSACKLDRQLLMSVIALTTVMIFCHIIN